MTHTYASGDDQIRPIRMFSVMNRTIPCHVVNLCMWHRYLEIHTSYVSYLDFSMNILYFGKQGFMLILPKLISKQPNSDAHTSRIYKYSN